MSFVINFREEDAFPLAREGFIAMCGFKPGSEKHEGMLAAGMEIRKQGLGSIDLKALISEFGPDVIGESAITVGGVELKCDSVYLLEKEKVQKVLFYIVTANECSCGSEQILDRVYADIWGTAYVDAARGLLKDELISRCIGEEEKAELELSEAFGPGYYGMPTEELSTIFQIIDGSEIGVKCLTSCLMVPIKSCAGLFFLMEKSAKRPGAACRDCVGNRSGCKFCNILRQAPR